MPNMHDVMFRNEREAGGLLGVVPQTRMHPNQLWFVDKDGKLMAKIDIPDWSESLQIAEMLAETIEFVTRKKRTHVAEIWVHEDSHPDLDEALSMFADRDITEQEHNNNDAG